MPSFGCANPHMCINMSQNKAKTGDKRSKHALKSPKTRGEIIDKWITNGSVAASFCAAVSVWFFRLPVSVWFFRLDLYKCLLFVAPNAYMWINLYKCLVLAAPNRYMCISALWCALPAQGKVREAHSAIR